MAGDGRIEMTHVKLRAVTDTKRSQLTRLVRDPVKLNRETGDPGRTR